MQGKLRGLGWWAVAAVIVPLSVGAVRAQTPATHETTVLVVKGEVKQELRLGAADFKALPRTKVTAKDHDGVLREYEGVTLQSLLAKAGVPLGHEIPGKNMALAVVADATDGYRAVFSLAELDADFAGAQVMVADIVDGKPLDSRHGPVQTVVPGDKHQGRWVRMLKSITVQRVGG